VFPTLLRLLHITALPCKVSIFLLANSVKVHQRLVGGRNSASLGAQAKCLACCSYRWLCQETCFILTLLPFEVPNEQLQAPSHSISNSKLVQVGLRLQDLRNSTANTHFDRGCYFQWQQAFTGSNMPTSILQKLPGGPHLSTSARVGSPAQGVHRERTRPRPYVRV
jgi:hypothetical protein